MFRLKLDCTAQEIIFSEEVLTHFARFQQLYFWQKEAGGQLFARFSGSTIIIEKVTGPRKADWRRRCSYYAHRPSEQFEIQTAFKKNLHFVGDWHTHPEKSPTPSPVDIKSYFETFRLSRHNLAGMLFVIVGQEPLPKGLYVGICNGYTLTQIN